MTAKTRKRRMSAAAMAFLAVVALYIFVLIRITAIDRSEYDRDARVNTYSVTVEAARGDILDRNGATLVTNRQGNAIQFNAAFFPDGNQARNELILGLIRLCESRGEKWVDNLPIKLDAAGKPTFLPDRTTDIRLMRSENYLNLNAYASAADCLWALREMYALDDYDDATARSIASVRYEMWRTGYNVSTPYTFAKDVSEETVSIIKENSDIYQGVEPVVVTYREIVDGNIAPHVVGITGVISPEGYEASKKELDEKLASNQYTDEEKAKMQRDAYTLTDNVGKFGIESAMEQYLRGSKGVQDIKVAPDGAITSEFSTVPQTGDTVMLTIDSGLQRVAQNALRERVFALVDTSHGLDAAGAVVVLDVDTSEVLASASFPTFDLNRYYDDYDKLLKTSGNPLINRVIQSAYEPGSSIKPAMAMAALESGGITRTTQFYCSSVYDYYDQQFGCLGAHGSIAVEEAIEVSCNIFFYNVGNTIGIDVMNKYCSLLGLGQKTGVELDEVEGILAGRAYKESIGSVWRMGDTIQAAIGQSDNLFSIMQLGNYCATLANGGTRHQCHYVRSILSADRSKTIYEAPVTVLNETGFSKSNIDIVKNGMYRVAAYGTSAPTFAELNQKVGAKTGTTQVNKLLGDKYVAGNNGLIIAFAPYDDPEIAVACIVENVDSGSATAQVAVDIFKYYFATKGQIDAAQNTGELLR